MKSNSNDCNDCKHKNTDVQNANLRPVINTSFHSLETLNQKRCIQRKNDIMEKFIIEKEASDSNDSDCDTEYIKDFTRPHDDLKFRSNDMYQDFSCEQDSPDEHSTSEIVEKMNNEATTGNSVTQNYVNVYENSSDEDDEEQMDNQDKSSIRMDESTLSKRNMENLEGEMSRFTKRKRHSSNKETEDYNKRQKLENPAAVASEDIGQRMMRMMGYKAGHGLGKNKQGRLEPVQAVKQHGRRGLGHHLPGLEAASLKWDPAEEEVTVREDMEWLKNTCTSTPSLEEMQSWMNMGTRKMTIDDEFNFCDVDILRNIINSKTIFDKLDKVEMRRARTRSNPFETIRRAIFLNRAAPKMANMDKACNFMFTKPEGLKDDDLLYFADVCAGPGGFSEYVLWRKKWRAKGFGFTLRNENDFKLSDFYAGPSETFHPYYGPKEDGDVFDPSNQKSFQDLIMKHTNGKGVHFMMSDGGFSVEGNENIQEILSKQLYLCQCLVALMIVRTNGHFVTKLFDLFTPFSAGLIYLMYRCFDEISIFKPNTSRPANSERYLICKRKRANIGDVVEHLDYVNRLLLKNDDNNDVVQLVPLEELEREKELVQYLRKSNDDLGRKQIIGLRKIAAFCEDPTLMELKQADMRRQCLEYWEIPDESRTMPRYDRPQDRVKQLLRNSTTFLTSNGTVLTEGNIDQTILNQPYDWFCMPCGTGPHTDETKKATFYFGLGKTKVYRYSKGYWIEVTNMKLELPADTLLYAEMVYEMTKEHKHQKWINALHILDAYMLGAEDVSQKYIENRHELIKKFCDALRKPSDSDYVRVRAKQLYPVNRNIDKRLDPKQRRMKNGQQALVYELPRSPSDYDDVNVDTSYFVLNSILFLKSTAPNWNRYFGKTHSMTYVFNIKTGDRCYDKDRPTAAEASFTESFENRVVWYWPNNTDLPMEILVKGITNKCPEYSQRL